MASEQPDIATALPEGTISGPCAAKEQCVEGVLSNLNAQASSRETAAAGFSRDTDEQPPEQRVRSTRTHPSLPLTDAGIIRAHQSTLMPDLCVSGMSSCIVSA